jgi:hypothetical protein
MVLTGNLIARGHHSFGEMHHVLKQLGYPIKIITTQKDYYEQFLTQDFIKSDAYQDFLATVSSEIESIVRKKL